MGKKTKKKAKPLKETSSRKRDHVKLVIARDVAHRAISTGYDSLRFVHNALPELSLEEIDTSTVFFGNHLDAPLLVSSMTGGYSDALAINRDLAIAAQEFGIAMAVGSARQAMEDKTEHPSYSVARKENPDGLLFTNVGAAEIASLHREKKIDKLKVIVDLVQADGLIVHLNPLQELLQPEGNTNFTGVLAGIESVVKELGIAVIAKEVGAGISREVAARLLAAGVRAIDVAGAGGTSWAGVEILRRKKKDRPETDVFWDWGIPTADALAEVAELKKKATFGLIASGGIRDGIDVAKSIALRADLVGMARPLLKSLSSGKSAKLHEKIEGVIRQLRAVMFLTGSRDLLALAEQPIEKLI
jgi:isopentenyl-diphosphate delta-isomerase